MQGERDGQTSSPPPSMLTDETTKIDNNTTSTSSLNNSSTELAYLPIGCSVSAKYRGAFCSAQVKAIEKQVKLKVTLVDSGDTITISEEQIVHSAPLRIGNTVTIRITSSNRRQSNDSNSSHHYSRSGLAAFINPTNPDEKQATIKQIIDNSIYTVVFNDGDERSLRRSSLCLQGVRLYQTQYGQQKILEEIPSPPPSIQASSSSSTTTLITSNETANANDITSIVAIKRHGTSDQQVFPALVLKRKALADYMWVRSFVDGREYIVHARDDVHTYHNNPDIQALCRSTSKQATLACEKFIKYNQIPAVWHKKKRRQEKSDDKNSQSDAESTSESDSSSSDSEDEDEIDEETTEEKDSFVAQLFAFMDDRGTPINNIPKVQNYDLDLHRLFKIVRMLGGYNKVTKNDQWGKVHIKMGLPDEVSSENGRSIEHAYKKYLFAYEDLSKKLGSMNAPSAYFGGRTSLGSDSRRSLIRVRQQQQEEEKASKKLAKAKPSPAPVKQKSRKSNESRPSTDSKPTPSSSAPPPPAKKPTPAKASAIPVRKKPNKMKPSNVISSSSSESESESDSDSSDDQSDNSSSSTYTKAKAKPVASTQQKKPAVSSSAIPKKVNQLSSLSSSSTTSASTKTEVKKVSTTTKASASDTKPSKLTITIPISKSKTTQSTNVQSLKKPNLTSSIKDEKKKVSEIKSVPIKTEPKTISSSINKKTVISTEKTSQITKTNQQQKQSSNTTSANKPPSSILPFKPKTTQSQTSTSHNNKEKSGITKPTSSSSVDAKQAKPTKINSSSVKTVQQERSSSAPVKKTKPTINEENITKPISSASSMKIPKISSANDSMKKSTASMDRIPKKQVSKDTTVKPTKAQENTPSTKQNHDPYAKARTPSPPRPTAPEPAKKTVVRELSPLPVTPVSPSPPHTTSLSSISDEPIALTTLATSVSSLQSISSSSETTPEVKPTETPLLFQSVSILSAKESIENEAPSLNPNKRPHSDEVPEVTNIPEIIPEQLSPSKRARRSISSQESIETMSTEQLTANDYVSTNRNAQLAYEDISINDVLLVTWGTQGIKQYPARCIEKNDDKKELLVHYTGWNSRHDEWIKLDRVIERKDANNANTLFQQRPRRTSQINSGRQHLDSTNSTISNEQPNQQTIITSISVDVSVTTTTTVDDDGQSKISKTISIEKSKIEESDIDDNSQGQSEIWTHVETISSTEDDALSYSSTIRTNQSDLNKLLIEEPANIRRSISTTNNENVLSTNSEFESVDENDNETESTRDDEQIQPVILKRRQSRATSSNNKLDSIPNQKVEPTEEILSSTTNIIEQPHQYPFHVKEETIDSSISTNSQAFQPPLIPPSSSLTVEPVLPSANILISPPATATGNRRASVRQQKRRTLRDSNSAKDSSISAKKKKLDNGNMMNSDIAADFISNLDQISARANSTEQPLTENATAKRNRPPGRRGGKKAANQQEYENEDYRSNSPSNITMRQQLKDMFKHRPSRYNFLDLNNNLTGDERIAHLKDRMRECQKVFFNLKTALVKIEKQRKTFLRKQKPILPTTTTIIQTTTTEILGTTTCT